MLDVLQKWLMIASKFNKRACTFRKKHNTHKKGAHVLLRSI